VTTAGQLQMLLTRLTDCTPILTNEQASSHFWPALLHLISRYQWYIFTARGIDYHGRLVTPTQCTGKYITYTHSLAIHRV